MNLPIVLRLSDLELWTLYNQMQSDILRIQVQLKIGGYEVCRHSRPFLTGILGGRLDIPDEFCRRSYVAVAGVISSEIENTLGCSLIDTPPPPPAKRRRT